jgi:MoaA/NifB/PqqE/SkfB family radical SAM enzyme
MAESEKSLALAGLLRQSVDVMTVTALPRKIAKGLPYLGKELRAIVSDHTPAFIAVPRTVHIWRNATCNAKCIMCDYAWLRGEALREYVTSPLKDEKITEVLPQIHELCGRGTLISYMGGEATTCPSVVKWVEVAARFGMDFRFTSNGYLIDEKMAAKLVAAGLFNIGISLESLDPKINEIIRPYPNGTAKTVRAIELLLEERERQRRRVSINIKTVLTDVNLESFIELVKRFGKVDGMMCTPQAFELMKGMPLETQEKLYIKDLSRFERIQDQIRELKAQGYNIHVTEQGLKDMLKMYREDKNKTSTMNGEKMEMDPNDPMCNIGTDNMWIQNGEVKLCPYHPAIGNVITDEATLKEMWQSEMTRRIRAQTRACRRLCTVSCLRRTPLTHKVRTFMKIA